VTRKVKVLAAHFKPFTRAASGAPSHRDDSRRSWTDDSHHRRRRYRKRNSGLIVIDLL
jgi:hypothetical protein